MPGGFAGRTLHLDLTSGQSWEEPLEGEEAEEFVGGLGFCVGLAARYFSPGTEALAPDNPLILGAGLLVGTRAPAAARFYAVSRLPATNLVGWCGGGGRFGSQLKYAGFDQVVIRGRAAEPAVVVISDEGVEIRPAAGLWGRGIKETTARLRAETGSKAGIIAIGPGGENRVVFSLALADEYSTLGRGGLGAVMGSKNLKAVIARGRRAIRVFDSNRYKELVRGLLARIRSYPYLKEWQELGLLKSLPLVSGELYLQMRKQRLACPSCPIGDKDLIEIPDGPFAGFSVRSTSVVNLLTPLIHGLKDWREAVKGTAALDDLGLDLFEFFGLLDFARRLVSAGLIMKEKAEPPIELSSLSSLESWAIKISRREGLGDLLAGGINRLLAELGPEAKELAPPVIKGMIPYVGPKASLAWNYLGTMELGQLLDPRGPHVGASGSPTYFGRRPLEAFPKHLERMGVPAEARERILPGLGHPGGKPELKIGRLLKFSHLWFMLLGSLGICARAQINRFYDAELCAALYEAATGIPTDVPGLQRRLEKVFHQWRRLNLACGLSPESESIPGQWFQHPPFLNYLSQQPITREEVEEMIADYYEEWGWERRRGQPPAER